MSTESQREGEEKLAVKKPFFDDDFRRDLGNGFKSSIVLGTKVAAVAAPLVLVVGTVNWIFGKRQDS